MNPLAAVLAGHLIGDWVVQTDWQAENKTTSWKANQQHMLGYHLALAAFCFLAMPVTLVAAVIVVSWVTHSIIDRRWPVVRLMQATRSVPFSQTTFGVIATDQALHLSIICLLVGWAP
jgi:predicted membrane-bound dolichyl-phosphate-mannose-protein mannosyltransferase